jgi:L-seryl-tRNA(Ser) seleniumtransferase
VPDPRRATPRTDTVLADPRLQRACVLVGRELVKGAVREALDRCRAGEIAPQEVADAAYLLVPPTATTLRGVINATGVLVHTNLGRAPLSPAARAAVDVAAGATDLEYDVTTGGRGARGAGALAALRAAVPSAEAVHVVNNGAAALALAAAGLAQGRTIVVARGELVEIGDGFRIPELLESAGARLREVGTTNRVRLDDYARAIDEHTALVLKVHPSNFVIDGFTSSVPVSELATLPRPLVVDIGSGLLQPHPRLPDEPSASAALRAGADLVTASGDKLLGGPQCGLMLGSTELVEGLRRHPLARALRVDKLTLAALEATLRGPLPPVAAALSVHVDDLRARAEAVAARVREFVPAEAVASTASVGGGGAPGVTLPSAAVAVAPALAAPLRRGRPSVVGHLAGGRLLLDLLAVAAADDDALVEALRRVAPVED